MRVLSTAMAERVNTKLLQAATVAKCDAKGLRAAREAEKYMRALQGCSWLALRKGIVERAEMDGTAAEVSE